MEMEWAWNHANVQRMEFTLRFRHEHVIELAKRYVETNPVQADEIEIIETIAPAVRSAGFYTKEQFLKVCYWKTPRSRPLCERNEEALVQEATKIALAAKNEYLRIGVLDLLEGVGWPTASVLLHFAHSNAYPILDVRALWSLSVPEPSQYDSEFWLGYTKVCSDLANKIGVDMRTLDRALWQFSREKQGPL